MANLNRKNVTTSNQSGPVEPDDKTGSAGLTSLQKSLTEMWCEVLKIETIDVHTSFLEAGGDSILATLLSIRIENSLGIKVSLLDIFDASTIARQAEMLQALKDNHGYPVSNPLYLPESSHKDSP